MTTDHHNPTTAAEHTHRLVADILAVAADLDDDGPRRLALTRNWEENDPTHATQDTPNSKINR